MSNGLRCTCHGRLLFRLLGACAVGALVVAVPLAFGVETARADCTPSQTVAGQGDYYRGAGRDNGTRSYISGTATNNSCGYVWFSGAVQTGEIKENTGYGPGDDCNTDGAVGRVAIVREYVSSDLGIDYTCEVYQDIARSDFGSGGNFSAVLGTNWEAFYNSNQINNPVALGFSSGYTVARAEAAWLTSAPTYDITWGPSGHTPLWQFKTNSSGCCTSYTNVSSYDSTTASDPGWSFANPPNFEITR